MFPVARCHHGLKLINELLTGLNLRKEVPELKRKSGIDPQELSGFLSEIQNYHKGVYKHSLNVARLSAQLALQLDLKALEVYIIAIGGLLHDFGKIRLPHAILDKQNKLTENEWMLVKKHPQVGIRLVSRYEWAQQLEPMILLHHERLDGQGYYAVMPENIPLSTRIITIADAFDAMFSPRPYQKQRNNQACWEEMERCGGTQFDSDLLPTFYSVTARIEGFIRGG